MGDKDRGLEKLQKLKMEIEKDIEKKTGRKIIKEAQKKKLSLSDDIRKRLTANKTSAVKLDDINTFIDMERKIFDTSLNDLKGIFRTSVNNVGNIIAKENLKGLLELLNKNVTKADQKFAQIIKTGKKDYVFFNYFLTQILIGKDMNNELKAFYRSYPDSPYPFLAIIFYTIFKTGSYATLKSMLSLVEKDNHDVLLNLIGNMVKHDFHEVTKNIGVLYRQNEFKDFQNIAGALAYLANGDDDSYKRLLTALEKKEHHHCSKIYYEYLTREEVNSEKVLRLCPTGKYLLAKKMLKNGNIKEAKELSKDLVRLKDPHGILLQSSILYAGGDQINAYRVWYELLKSFRTVLIGWDAHSTTEFKGLGLGRTSGSPRIEEYTMPDNVATFKTQMEKRVNLRNDFEIFLYPLEELKTLFTPYPCQLYYELN